MIAAAFILSESELPISRYYCEQREREREREGGRGEEGGGSEGGRERGRERERRVKSMPSVLIRNHKN